MLDLQGRDRLRWSYPASRNYVLWSEDLSRHTWGWHFCTGSSEWRSTAHNWNSIKQTLPSQAKLEYMVEENRKRTSPVANAMKFSTVFGTTFPNNPITILPTSLSPIFTSKNTWIFLWREQKWYRREHNKQPSFSKSKVVRNCFCLACINIVLLFQRNPFRATKIRLCRELFENWWLYVLILIAFNGSVGLLYLKFKDSVQEDFSQTCKSLKLNVKD